MKYIVYYLTKVFMFFVKVLAKPPIGAKLFKEINAAYSVGVGSEAFQEKRYDDAYKTLKPIADYKISDVYVGSAQYIVGVMYYHGLGIEKNYDVAVNYLKNAKENNNDDADRLLNKILSSNDE